MRKIFPWIQFLPLSIFLGVARAHGFASLGWALAFEWAALAALLETILLIPILGNKMSRLIAGANLFLILGGLGFWFDLPLILNFLDSTRESGVFVAIGLICGLGMVATQTGVFETMVSKTGVEKKYSLYFLVGVVGAFVWSFAFRGQPMLAGTLPFIFLILFKYVLQKRLTAAR